MQRILFVLFIGTILSSCASAPVYQSLPQKTAVIIDGRASDWQQPLEYYSRDSKVSFTISNDSANLYLCLEAYDVDVQKKIVRGGIQFWIDTTGGKSQQIGLLFPVRSTEESDIRGEGSRSSNSSSYGSETPSSSEMEFDPIGTLRKQYFRSASEIELTGFHPPANGRVPIQNAFGIRTAINWDTTSNVLIYEAAIPFRTFLNRPLTPHDTARMLGLTITVNGIKSNRSNRAAAGPATHGDEMPSNGGMAGGMPVGGAGGGMGRGGGGRHRGGGGSAESNPLGESKSLSFKLQLAPPGDRFSIE